MLGAPPTTRARVSWALVETARNPYVSLVYMFVFAPYFAVTVVGDAARGQRLWSQSAMIAGLCVAFLAPVLGATVDRTGRRKPWVAGTVVLMSTCCWLLWYAYPGTAHGLSLTAILLLVMILMIGFECGAVAHNAMLVDLAPENGVGRLSGMGLTSGAIGSVCAQVAVLFCIVLPATHEVDWAFLPRHAPFGLHPATFEHARIVGPICAVWMVIFVIPFLLWTPDHAPTGLGVRAAMSAGLAQLGTTVRHAGSVSNVARFLLARMLFNDGTQGIVAYCGIYAAGVFGWSISTIMVFALILSACCILGGMLAAALDSRLGSRKAILICLGATSVAVLLAVSVSPNQIFFMTYQHSSTPVWSFPYFRTLPELVYLGCYMTLAITITALIANSRAMMARIAPHSMMSQFFGLYALSGTATAFLGHAVVAAGTVLFASQRAGFGSLLVLVALGSLLMIGVREERAADLPLDARVYPAAPSATA